MPFRPVLELAVSHPYLAGGALPGGALVPDAATAARLRGLRLVARPTGNRLTVFGSVDPDGASAVAPGGPVTLGFAIPRLDPALAAATDTAALGAAPLFTDEGADAGDPQPLRLAKGKGRDDSATLATVAIKLAVAELAPAGPPRRCVVALPAATARWCYHVVTDMPVPLSDWRIARGGGAAGTAPSFGDAGLVELAEDDAADAVGTELRRRNQGLRVLRFVSGGAFAAREAPVRALELHAGATRLFGSLPNPSPASVARIGTTTVFDQVLRIVTA